jgi:hypothetical protein
MITMAWLCELWIASPFVLLVTLDFEDSADRIESSRKGFHHIILSSYNRSSVK